MSEMNGPGTESAIVHINKSCSIKLAVFAILKSKVAQKSSCRTELDIYG